MKFSYYFVLLFCALLFQSCSFLGDKETNNIFIHDEIQYQVEFLSSKSVRILSFPEGDTLVTQRLVVRKEKGPFQSYTYTENEKEYLFATNDIRVSFDKKKASFRFYEVLTGRLLLKEKENKTARVFRKHEVGGESCLEVTQGFIPSKEEAIYGLGQYQDGIVNYRGKSVLLLQSNKDIVNPFLLSTNGYGILWDNYSSSKFEDNEKGYSFTSEVGDASDYYFVYGEDLDEVVSGYRNLTGDVPMFGKWAYGFWQSKERYKSFDELRSVVKEYRKREIPLDNIVQDWEYWGDKSHWNNLKFDSKNFNNAKQVIADLQNEDHVHVMLSVWPGFGPQTDVYHSLDSIGALFEESTWAGYKVFDVYNPYARDVFWKYFKHGLYNTGIDGWWMDATEPSFRDGFTQLKQEERVKSAGKTYIGSFHRYLNTYSLEMMKDLYRRLRLESDQKRVFILTRSAFASQQHYGTAVWSGDVSASWENMHKQLKAGLNLSMSGIPYWTSDTGGFFVTEREGQYPEGLQSEEYKELYSRWFQFGSFTPLFRVHGTNIPREVWQFGDAGTRYYDNQVKYIKLRYRLLPYIYSLSYQVTANHYTLLRGLAMDFRSDSKTYNIDDSYMFGPSLLIRPVFHSISEDIKVSTYLPKHKGKYWYDFWTDEVFKGGIFQNQLNILDVLPIYVKAGSIIPTAEIKQYAMQYPDHKIELHIYGGADASFVWYEDEGDSYNYEKGIFSTVLMKWDDDNRILTLGARKGEYPNMVNQINFSIKLCLPTEEVIVKDNCIYTGEELKVQF